MQKAVRSRVDFDAIAPFYERVEKTVFGGLLDSTRLASLRFVPEPARALLLGEGDGRFLAEVMLRWPECHFVVVEASPGMIREAGRRLERHGWSAAEIRRRVEWQQISLPGVLPRGPFDLVATHFFLDCFDECGLRRWIPETAGLLSPQGRWLVSEFRIPSGFLPWRWGGSLLIVIMYRFFRTVSNLRASRLPDYQPVMESTELVAEIRSIHAAGLLVSQVWSRPRC